MTSERTAVGYYEGRPPLGTCFNAAGEGLIPNPDEWPTIMDAFELLDDGEPYRSITEATDLSLATISRLADRGPDYYHGIVETAAPVQ